MTKRLAMQRNPFFLPSGFEPQEQINILEATKENRERLDKIKQRKRKERQNVNLYNCSSVGASLWIDKQQHRNKRQKVYDQIQRGYDLATKWGWDGINRPYTPKIMSVFGGRKRRKG